MIIHEDYLGHVHSALYMLSRGIMPTGMKLSEFLIEKTGLPLIFMIMKADTCLFSLSSKTFQNCNMPEYKRNSSLKAAS